MPELVIVVGVAAGVAILLAAGHAALRRWIEKRWPQDPRDQSPLPDWIKRFTGID